MLKYVYLRNFFALIPFLPISCMSAPKNYDYMMQPEYQKRTVLEQSLLNGVEPLSEESIKKILEARVAFPKTMTLAIVRLDDSSQGLQSKVLDEEIADKFYEKDVWGSRIRSVVPVPQIMLAKPVTLANLRQAGVLLQADALLVIKPQQRNDWKFNLTEKNRAKSTTSLEVLLIDTRTSIVPYTSLITESAELTSTETDYNAQDLLRRASEASEKKALLEIPKAIGDFVLKAM